MRKYLVSAVVIVLLLTLSISVFAAEKRSVLIDPAHGGRSYGFEFNGKLEKDMNLESARKFAQYLSNYTLLRESDVDNQDGPFKNDKVKAINPDVILGIHHHGKYGVHIEYNKLGAQLAYQIAAYFASEEIPYKLVYYRDPWLFSQPHPAIVLIYNEEIEQNLDYAFLAKLLEGLE